MAIEATFQSIAQAISLGVQATAILIVAIGAIEALVLAVRNLFDPVTISRRKIWLGFAAWILLSLEFTLGADVIGTAISPSWDDIGKLGAIATIRTALSFFLARDMEHELLPETATEEAKAVAEFTDQKR